MAEHAKRTLMGQKRKLPDDNRLRRDVTSGLGLRQICMRYGCSQDHARRRIKALGLEAPLTGDEQSVLTPTADKIVIERHVSASEVGGTAIQRISLPRISMHVAALEAKAL